MPSRAAAPSQLSATVETWILQGVAASRYLARLYRALGDGRQAAAAILIGQSVTERMERMGLQAQLPALATAFGSSDLDETQAEEAAWQCLITAQAGLCAYLSLLDWMGQPTSGLQGQRTATHKAFQRALYSYRVAFPEEMTRQGIARALEEASRVGAEAFNQEVEDLPEQEQEGVLAEVRVRLLDALRERTMGS
jgi:hypothetical protein